MNYLDRAIADGHARLSGEGKQQKITYVVFKGDPNNDIQPVSMEVLIGSIKKCHQTHWAGGKLSPNFSV